LPPLGCGAANDLLLLGFSGLAVSFDGLEALSEALKKPPILVLDIRR